MEKINFDNFSTPSGILGKSFTTNKPFDYSSFPASSTETAILGQLLNMLGSFSKWLHSEDTGGILEPLSKVLKVELDGGKTPEGYKDFEEAKTQNGEIDKSILKEILRKKYMRQTDRAFVWYFSNLLKKKYFEGSNKNWAKPEKSKKVLGDLVTDINSNLSQAFEYYKFLVSGAGSKGKYSAFKSSSVAGDFFDSAINLRPDLFDDAKTGVNIEVPSAQEIAQALKKVSEEDPEFQSNLGKVDKAFSNFLRKLGDYSRADSDEKKEKAKENYLMDYGILKNLLGACSSGLEVVPGRLTITKGLLDDAGCGYLGEKKVLDKIINNDPDILKKFITDYKPTKEEQKAQGQQAKEGDQQEDSSKLAPEADYDPLSDTNLPPEQRKQYLVQAYLKGEINGKEFARIDAAIQNSTSLYTTNIQQPVVQPMGVPVMGQPQMVMPGVVGV